MEEIVKTKKKSGPKNRFSDPVKMNITIERELRDKVADMFPGQASKMICSFLEEAVKGRKVLVFTLK